MESTGNCLKGILSEWYQNHNIPLNSKQLIAFSGGSDSVALLYLLRELCLEQVGVVSHLHAAYYNHNLRSEDTLNREIEQIRGLTFRWNISLSIGESPRGEIENKAARDHRSLEDVAREARYAFLQDEMTRFDSEYLVLAHHRNDQWETIMSRFFQGSGLSGLRGISPVTGNRLRPLLSISKIELISCLTEQNLSWSTDDTNIDEKYQRNHVRHTLIPTVEKVFPGYEKSLTQLSEKISRADDFLIRTGADQPWEGKGSTYSIDLDYYNQLDPVIREYTLFYIIDRLLKGKTSPARRGKRIPYRFIKPLLSGNLSHPFKLQGHGILFKIEFNKLILREKAVEKATDNFFFQLERKKTYFFENWCIDWKETGRPAEKSVVLLIDETDILQLRTTGGGHVVLETSMGVCLAKFNGKNWKVREPRNFNCVPSSLIIRELSEDV